MTVSREINLAYVAKRHFIDRRTKMEIADELGISRFKVARMIDEAYESGIVQIAVSTPTGIDFDASTRLREAYGLRHAIVVHAPGGDEASVRRALAPAGADLLREIAREGDVVGVSTGRTLQAMGHHIGAMPYCDVVQLTGVADPAIETGLGVISRLAAASGGPAHYLYSPLTVSDTEAADALRRQPSIRRTLDRMASLDLAVVTIGSWDPPKSQLFDNMIDTDLRSRLLSSGIRAEVCATLFQSDGRMSEALASTAISVTTAQLTRARVVLGVAGGKGKEVAVRAALLSGVVTGLVTDTETADYLLAAQMST